VVRRLGISTSWNRASAQDAISMIKEIREMGFDRFELNFTLTFKDICDIISIREKEGIDITSLHNFCPIPKGVSPKKASPDYYSLSSLDEDERRRGVDATKTTIETAERLKARVVILHLGKIKIKDRTRELAATLDDKANYKRVKRLMLEEREEDSSRYFDNALLSMEELLKFAKDKKIKLGIENRYYYNEIPSIDEMEVLLKRFDDDYAGYWHDVGHAQIFENIGLYDHKRDYLDRLASKIIGMHLHDVTGVDDHRAPLQGSFDFSILKPYIKKDTLLVLEPHQPATSGQIMKGAEYLERLFGDTL